MKQCSHGKCQAPRVSCRMGEDAFEDCEFWRGGSQPPADEDENLPGLRLPWSGSALGTTDLPFLTSRGETKLVALAGPHNAGKSTLLAAWYQLLGRRGIVGTKRFAGSFTLEGWEAVAHSLRWESGGPNFPPHTPSGTGRVPGLLHLALRDGDQPLRDYLFADSPGEWFHRWAVNEMAADAEGARWLADRASSFIIVADCDALAGQDRGPARGDLIALIRRVAKIRGSRPVAFVWAKADRSVPTTIRDAITRAAMTVMPDVMEFETSVLLTESASPADPVAALDALLEWCLSPPRRGFDLPVPPVDDDDLFFRIGARA